MKKIKVLPTWLIVKASQVFLRKNHPLKKGITLANWAKHSTPANDHASIMFWVFIICIPIALYIVFGMKPMN